VRLTQRGPHLLENLIGERNAGVSEIGDHHSNAALEFQSADRDDGKNEERCEY